MLHLCISDALFNLVWTQVTVVALGLALEPGPALKLARQSLGLDSQTYPGYGHRTDCNRAPSHLLSQRTSRPNVSGPRPCEDGLMTPEMAGGWFLRAFDVGTDQLRVEVELPGFSRHALEAIVTRPPDDPGVHTYRVDLDLMKPWLPRPLDPVPNAEWYVEFNT